MSNTTKANPNAAMTEAQPVAQQLERSTMASLRSMTHRDIQGNPIVDPDLSNPTRYRFERPLETVRRFEEQIDREYSRRQQVLRAESYVEPGNSTSRRSSYFGGQEQNNRQSQVNGGGYYAGRHRDSVAESSYAAPMVGPSRNKFAQRQQSEPMMVRQNGHGVYPSNGYEQSRDTVGTGESSSSEAWNHSTDPSSENSSIDRVNSSNDHWGSGAMGGPVQHHGAIREGQTFADGGGYPRPMNNGNGNGYNPGFNTGYSNAQYSLQNQGGYQNGYQNGPQNGNGYQNGTGYQNGFQNGRPPVPPHGNSQPARKPIKLGGGVQAPLSSTNGNADPNDKRKSWLKRRFSKN